MAINSQQIHIHIKGKQIMEMTKRQGSTAIKQVGENRELKGTPIIKRGDIWLVDFSKENVIGGELQGYRPVVVVQNELGNKYGSTVIVAGITSNVHRKPQPTHQFITLNKPSCILYEQLRAVDKSRFNRFIGSLDEKEMAEMNEKLLQSLGLAYAPTRAEMVEETDVKKYVMAWDRATELTAKLSHGVEISSVQEAEQYIKDNAELVELRKLLKEVDLTI